MHFGLPYVCSKIRTVLECPDIQELEGRFKAFRLTLRKMVLMLCSFSTSRRLALPAVKSYASTVLITLEDGNVTHIISKYDING